VQVEEAIGGVAEVENIAAEEMKSIF